MGEIITPDWYRLRMKGRLTPGEVAALSRVVRAKVIPEIDLVSSWGTGPWAAKSLDGLLKQGFVTRRAEVGQFVGQEGVQSKPGPWIIPTEAGEAVLPEELDIAFPPSGNWLTFGGVPLNHQPPDLLMQLIEYFLVRDGALNPDKNADIRPAKVLKEELLARISEIKRADGYPDGEN
jgi:hypothetical protein